MHNLRRCVLLSAAALGVALPTSFTAFPATISSRPATTPLTVNEWAVDHTAPGGYSDFQWGGLATGDLAGDGQIDLVAAYPDGVVRVFNAADGTVVWAQQTDGRISSTATLADLYGNGQQETIVTTKNGSVYVFDPHGNIAPGWPQHTVDGGPHTGFPTAFFASVAVGDLFGDKHMELTATSWDHYLYVWDSAGNWVHGFPINLADTAWVTPALIPSTVNPGGLDIIAGADSGGPPTEPYPAGGEYFRFSNTGCPDVDYVLHHGGNSCQTGGFWAAHLGNTAWSSPAVFSNGSNWMTVTGSGFYFGAPGAPGCPDATCGRQISVRNPDATTASPGFNAPTAGQIMTSPAVGNLGNGDNNDIVATSNGSSGNVVGSCINGWASNGTTLAGFPICNSTVWFSNPVIGPVDSSGVNGIWIGDSAWLTSYSHTGTRLQSIPFGDNTGYAPAAPVLFNTGLGTEVAGIGATSRAGGNYNTWRILVKAVTGNTVGHNVWPRFHGDNHADGVAQTSIAPSVPFNITAGAGDTQAALTWSVPADVGSVAPTSYSVSIYDKTSSLATGLTNPQTFTTNNGTVTGLTNGHPYFFRISASNGATSDLSPPSYSVTPVAVAAPAAATNNTVSGTSQYMLPNSDGATWQDMDPTNLAMTVNPGTSGTSGNYLITGNADLWTAQGGYNQDIGICVIPNGSNCTGSTVQLVAWKESGGFAGTFSPNAAFVQQVVSMTPGTAYTVKLVWKTNKPAKGATIFAAAGNGPYSHSRLSVRPMSVGSAFKSDTGQPQLTGNDGATWVPINGTNLTASFTGGVNQVAVLSGNADLWTANAGYNQDIGILVTGGAFGTSGTVVAWKESGGFGGTFSPNAAYVETSIPVAATVSYTATLVWKTNKPEPNGVTIVEGAGGPAPYSPTTIVAQLAAADHVQTFPSAKTDQFSQANSDGTTWTEVNATTYAKSLTSPSPSCLAVIGANSDLWTTVGGYNQDIAIFVNGAGPVAWKESGGFAGTFSPNAAMVETEVAVSTGTTITIEWKTNKPSGTTIYAGAGNQASALGFSPTTLLVQYIGC
jgi:hypothetical protein